MFTVFVQLVFEDTLAYQAQSIIESATIVVPFMGTFYMPSL